MTLNFYLKVPNIVHHQKVWQFCYFFKKKKGGQKTSKTLKKKKKRKN
jgi:hypothetical protein